MAEEPKPETKDAQPADNSEPSAARTSPAPAEAADDVKTDGDASASHQVQAEPLSDGTTPTILTPGQTHRSVSKSKSSITSIYRRADIMTTLLTFAGALVAGAIIIGAYMYLTGKTAKPTATPKVATLDQADLDKLGAFFSGNSAGTPSEVLTISASSLFKNRVALSSDLKVAGGVQVSGTTALGDLTVDKVSTLGITNVRGQLTAAGPSNLQGPATFGNGISVIGNVTASGNGTFGGSLAAGVINTNTLSVSGPINLSNHINTGGLSPAISSGTIDGNDTSGVLSFTGTSTTVTFRTAYTKIPHIMLTPNSACPGTGQYFVRETGGTGFIINNPAACTSFNYWVVQ
jgi:hypothetical protein